MGLKSKKKSKIDSALTDVSNEIHKKRLDATVIKKMLDEIEQMLSTEKHKWWFKDKNLNEYYKRYDQLRSVYLKEIEHSVIIIETDGIESQRHKDDHYNKELSTGELIEVVKEEITSNTTNGNTIVREDQMVSTESNLIKKKKEGLIKVEVGTEAVEFDVKLNMNMNNMNQSVNINDCNSNNALNPKEKSRRKMIKYSLIFFIIVVFIIMTIIACLLLI